MSATGFGAGRRERLPHMKLDTHGNKPAARRVEAKWQDAGAGVHYEQGRWGSPRSRDRDPRMVARLLSRFPTTTTEHGALDVPCGSGRLRPALEASGFTGTGVDVSAAMLSSHDQDRTVQGSIWRLPFRDDTFDAVVCCRLLHHLTEEAEVRAALSELVRVTRDVVIASFWSAATWHAYRRRIGLRRGRRPDARRAIGKARLAGLVREAGAEVAGYEHSFRFVSQQTFFAARKRTWLP